ncbi:MAG: stage III sporulation protein AD [Lachnospiraceae bacterium]|nr:stage III sporulation protein AD [Candidatus Fimimorpha excrementavium]
MLKVAAIGLVSALLAMQLKQVKAEYSNYIALAAGILIFAFTLSKLDTITKTINQIQSYISIDSAYVGILVKMIGITYLSEFACNICRDAGYHSIAGQIEIFAKLTIMGLSLPVILALLETITDFLS